MIFPAVTILLLAQLCSPQPVGNQAKRVQREAAPKLKGQDLDPPVSLFVKEVERQGLASSSENPSSSRGRAFSELSGVHRKSENTKVDGILPQSPATGQEFATAFVHRTFGGFQLNREHRKEPPQLHPGHSTRLTSHPSDQLQALKETSRDHLRNSNSRFNQHDNSISKDLELFNENSINPHSNTISSSRQPFLKAQEIDFHRKKTSSGNLLNLPQRPVVGFRLPIQNDFVTLLPGFNSNAGFANEPDTQKVALLGQRPSGPGKFDDFSSDHNEHRNQYPTHLPSSIPFANSPSEQTFNSNRLQFQQLQNPQNNVHHTRSQQQNGHGNDDPSQHFRQLSNHHSNKLGPGNFQFFTKNNENVFQQNHFQQLKNGHINNDQKEHFQPANREHGQTDTDLISHSLPSTRQTFPRESRNILKENIPSTKESKHNFTPIQISALNPKLYSHLVPRSPNRGGQNTIISSGSSNPNFGQGFVLRLEPSLVFNDASSTDKFGPDSSASSNNFPIDSSLPLENHRTQFPHKSEGKLIKQEKALQENNPVKAHINPNLEENISSVNDFANFRPSFFGRSLESQESNIVPEGRSLGDDNPSPYTKRFAPGVLQGGFLPSSFFGPLSAEG